MTRPIVPEDAPWRSERARSLRSNPSSAIAPETRAAGAGGTAAPPVIKPDPPLRPGPGGGAAPAGAPPPSPLIPRDPVLRPPPACRATSRMVGRGARKLAALHHQLRVAEPAAPPVAGLRVADAHVERPAAGPQVVE